jgi:DNA-binding winged helix-turn-helix (wHTH) protein/TolB-like protein
MPNEDKHFYEFNGFRLDSERRLLWRDGEIVPITPKALEVLISLVEKPGDLLERGVLLERVWKDTFVEEANLNFTISSLRKILDRNGEKLIQTVPRRGYRFTGTVNEVFESKPAESVIERHTRIQIEKEEVTLDDELLLSGRGAPNRVRAVRVGGLIALLIFGLIGAVVYMRVASPAEGRQNQIKSLAVLPLKSFEKNDSDEALRLRITDALITRLGSLKEIAVRPTNSILRFADGETDVIEAGREIEVDAVLDGRVQSENDRLRITLQLVSVGTGEQLWSEQFDGQADSILALQDEISNRLRKHLAYSATDNFSRQPTESNAAYEAYLKGRYFLESAKSGRLFQSHQLF